MHTQSLQVSLVETFLLYKDILVSHHGQLLCSAPFRSLEWPLCSICSSKHRRVDNLLHLLFPVKPLAISNALPPSRLKALPLYEHEDLNAVRQQLRFISPFLKVDSIDLIGYLNDRTSRVRCYVHKWYDVMMLIVLRLDVDVVLMLVICGQIGGNEDFVDNL